MGKSEFGFGSAVLLAALVAAAQNPIAYPDRGQSVAQQTEDDTQCRAAGRGSLPSRAESVEDSAQRVLGAAGPASGVGLTGGVQNTQTERAARIGAAAGAEKRHAAGEESASAGDGARGYARCMEERGYTIK
jgi:hypothetical protein